MAASIMGVWTSYPSLGNPAELVLPHFPEPFMEGGWPHLHPQPHRML